MYVFFLGDFEKIALSYFILTVYVYMICKYGHTPTVILRVDNSYKWNNSFLQFLYGT